MNNIKKGNGSWQAPNYYYIIYTIKKYIKHVSSLEYYTFIVAPKTQQPIRRGLTNQARPANSQSQKAFQIKQVGQQPMTEGLSNQAGKPTANDRRPFKSSREPTANQGPANLP